MNRLAHVFAPAVLCAGCATLPNDFEQRLDDWQRQHDERSETNGSELPSAAGLSDLLQCARTGNPGLEAAFQRWKEALERVPQATKLPNPRLSFGVYLAEVETRTGPMQGRVGLSQMFPWPGKLDLAGTVAFEAAEAARELLEAARLDLEQRVRDAWYELAWLEQAISITTANRELLSHWESVARARLETGLGSHSDVIRAQVELGKLEDRVQSLSDLRRPVSAKLNAALNRASDAALPRPQASFVEPATFDEEQLANGLMSSSPRLRALAHHVEAARQSIELADKAALPDFSVGVDYTLIGSAANPGVSGSGDDAVALTFGVELPIWGAANRAGEREAEARMKRARSQQEQAFNDESSALAMAFYRLRDGQRRVDLFRGSLIPKGEEAVKALDSGYQAGDEGFLDLVDAQRVLLEFQLEAARAESDRAQALAEIERITGIQLHTEL